MMTSLVVLFWLLAALIFYIFAGYPALVFLLSRLSRLRAFPGDGTPRATIVIAAHNEAACIRETLENKLALDYPAERLEIIVVSDASTDSTDEIVREFAARGVQLIRQSERLGKSAALNLGVESATGEILVFSDANSQYEASALRALVRCFEDPSVGYATGKMIYVNPDGSLTGEGCSTYMKYENMLRGWESRLGSIVGVDGGVDGMRRSLYTRLRPDSLPDFALPLEVVRRGFRVVYSPAAVLRECTVTIPADEYRMRVRVSLRALWAILERPNLLNPFRFGIYSWQLLSHKVLRYVAFVPMLLLLAVNGALAAEPGIYRLFLWLHGAFYLTAGVGFLLSRQRYLPGALALPYYFVLIQAASCHAVLKLLAGEKIVVWSPRKG